MKVEYINPFVNACVNTFKTMVNLDIKRGKPEVKPDIELKHDISGVIGLTGKAVGSVVVSFPKTLAMKITGKVIGSQVDFLNDDVIDIVGEIVNIISGNAKAQLEEFHMSLSIPNVIVGDEHSVLTQKGVPVVRVPFESPEGEFFMYISLKEVD